MTKPKPAPIFSCPFCRLHMEENKTLRTAIKQVMEWGEPYIDGAGNVQQQCPFCHNLKRDGHKSDCIRILIGG